MKRKLVPMLALASGLALTTAACGQKSDNSDNPGGANPTATAPDTGATEAAATPAEQRSRRAVPDRRDPGRQRRNPSIGKAAETWDRPRRSRTSARCSSSDHTKAQGPGGCDRQGDERARPDRNHARRRCRTYKMTTSMSGGGLRQGLRGGDGQGSPEGDRQVPAGSRQQRSRASDRLRQADLPTLKKHLQTAQSLQK